MILPLTAAAGPVDSVDPMIGTDVGSCMPGPCLPHASIYPSPDTTLSQPSGYRPGQPIVGFSQLHAQGTGGLPSYGNLLVWPQTGDVQIDEAAHASPATDVRATATRYDARLTKYNVGCSVVPTRHGAVYEFAFAPGNAGTVAIDVGRKLTEFARHPPAGTVHHATVGLVSGSVTATRAAGTIAGGGTYDGNWAPGKYRLYFAAQFDRPPTSVGTWAGTDVKPYAVRDANRQPLGVYAKFDPGPPVRLRLAISFQSIDQARHWLAQELPTDDLAAAQARADAAWNDVLGRVTFDGATPDQRRHLYTALWHAMVQPRDRTDDGSTWDDHYTLWDSWRTVYPLLAIVDPGSVAGVVNSFAARHRKNADGYVSTAFVAGVEYRTGQGGDEADNVIADAAVRHVPGIGWPAAFDVVKCHADAAGRTAAYRELGYVPAGEPSPYCRRFHSGSGTLAFAQNDFSASVVAAATGHADDAARWLARSRSWRNVWDAAATDAGFAGFPRGRTRGGPTTTPLANTYNVDFYEATSWEASFAPVFDLPGLVQQHGGRDRFVARLAYALDHHLIDFGNEPSFDTIWLPAAEGRPDLTSRWAAAYRDLYRGDDLPGDDDGGAMSSMYVFLQAGLYPIATTDAYYLHGPAVPSAAFRLANGRTFTVTAEHVSPANVYVQSATLDGVPLTTPVIHHADVLRGATLHFVMGRTPPVTRGPGTRP